MSDSALVVAVFASPVSAHLLHFAHRLGWHTVLAEPDSARLADEVRANADQVVTDFGGLDLGAADVVVSDHHRDELGPVLRDALAARPRWVGVVGSPRFEGPHVQALRDLGVPESDISSVHRPIGLDIGSRRPPEIALSALAGLVADRAGRTGGFHQQH